MSPSLAPLVRLAASLTLVLLAAPALAGKPGKAQVAALLKQQPALAKGRVHVSEVLADQGGGRYPVLFTTSGQRCDPDPRFSSMSARERREALGKDGKPELCYTTFTPQLGVIGGDGKGLRVLATLALPTTAPPTPGESQDGELTWGVNLTRDYDGDGRPELLLIYAYDGPIRPALGSAAYRDLCLVNLDDPPTVAALVSLRQRGAGVDGREYSYRFGPGAERTLTLTGEIGTPDDPDKTHRSQQVLRYRPDRGVWE